MQIRIDCLDDIANALSSLIRVNDATMVETFSSMSERKSSSNVRRIQSFSTANVSCSRSVAQSVVLAGSMDFPTALTKPVGDGNPDVLVAVNRARHAEAGSDAAERNSSMWS